LFSVDLGETPRSLTYLIKHTTYVKGGLFLPAKIARCVMFKRLYDKFVSWVRKLGEYPSIEEGNKIIASKPFTGCVEFSEFKMWYLNSKLHREDGPAVEWIDGSKEWFLNGQRHREDGPAVEKVDGSKEWYLNGKYHREDGPAREYADGTKEWWLNGNRHRVDGPAIEDVDGSKGWYLNGIHLFWLPPESQPFILIEEFIDEEGKKQIKVLNQEAIKTWPNLSGLKELAVNWEEEYVGDWEE
jgi:hypothetical protein